MATRLHNWINQLRDAHHNLANHLTTALPVAEMGTEGTNPAFIFFATWEVEALQQSLLAMRDELEKARALVRILDRAAQGKRGSTEELVRMFTEEIPEISDAL